MTNFAEFNPNSCFYVECKTVYASDGLTLIANFAPFETREQAVKYIAFREALYTPQGVCREHTVRSTENANTMPNVIIVHPDYTLSCASFTRKMNE